MTDYITLIKKKEQLLKEQEAEYESLLKSYGQSCLKHGITIPPKQILATHISKLKEYNELRDTGLKLIQLIANEKNCPLKTIFEEMGHQMKDT
ncbi:hypothetical protein TPHA_0D02170 [Tetrapisispora phaffii CBS 4417]|uniref:Uncharacterized protein n=1 Tax=Tetrapisispora phaffii (strain ATCC 24235 / CBS 4417 / NBRC 1672 / NRRL Y-8282 / UCD 70-5) TaxID=1071381 RepID=G8BSN4_TETPH|nr:hypothetical protein TPHA_0D02170 [Tetrapisispora phaffii CBS 4417]CCE62855.1 hypothetical protein TPHA_0D02170 [Tetrapisispora phaffii CBS 4417]